MRILPFLALLAMPVAASADILRLEYIDEDRVPGEQLTRLDFVFNPDQFDDVTTWQLSGINITPDPFGHRGCYLDRSVSGYFNGPDDFELNSFMIHDFQGCHPWYPHNVLGDLVATPNLAELTFSDPVPGLTYGFTSGDQLTVTQFVPEPSSFAIMLIGIVRAGLRLRRGGAK